MDSMQNQFKIEIFKRYFPKLCDLISYNNTYNFHMKFDNDVLTINNVQVKINYYLDKLKAFDSTEPEMPVATFEMQKCHIEQAPYLAGLDTFINEIINHYIYTGALNNVADLQLTALYYNYTIKAFTQK